MMKFRLAALVMILGLMEVQAQTPRQVIVEHFTNTRCSICASKNPAFYNTIHNTYPQLLHIAYHPSAPYVGCYFSQQNKSENDARTNFYGVYGSTPRAAVQGKAIPATGTLLPASAVDSTLNQLSPFELKIYEQERANDSVHVGIWILATDSHKYTNLNLYAAVTEDTVFYAAYNGENIHYDVFRQQVFAGNGESFPAPPYLDSAYVEGSFKLKPDWVKERISVTAMIQDPGSKYIVQAGRQSQLLLQPVETSSPEIESETPVLIFPNPTNNHLFIQTSNFQPQTLSIFDMNGRKLSEEVFSSPVDVSSLAAGIYFIELKDELRQAQQPVVVRRRWVKM